MGDSLPLILLSGEPLPKEPLPAYAARLARRVDPGRPCLVGGASFGGLVALEMAPHLQARACVLIASLRSPGELPWWVRLFRPAAALGPTALGWCAAMAVGASAPSLPAVPAGQLRRLSEPRAAFLRWASWAVLSWQLSRRARQVRVWQIHGDADRTLPIRYTRPDRVVAGGGHLLPLTHAQAVNEFLRRAEARAAEPLNGLGSQ